MPADALPIKARTPADTQAHTHAITRPHEHTPRLDSHLFRVGFRAGQVSPFLDHATEVNGVQRHLDLTYLVVLREAVEVVDGEAQSFGAHLGVRNLQLDIAKGD